MTVSAAVGKHVYNGNGVTIYWPYSFPISEGDEIKVHLTDALGVVTQLNSGYHVDEDNARVVYPAFGSGLNPLPVGSKITLLPVTKLTQELDLKNQGPFNAEVLERAFDKLTMIAQQTREVLSRTVKYPVHETPTADDTDAFLTRIEAARFQAETGVNAAATSATNAATSAASASLSALDAISSATSAASSKADAAVSATAASSAATAASGSATSAASSAAGASASATAAAGSASAASTSATAAAGSASAASTSATAAAGSASAASTSATAAAGSASAASTSQTAAAASAAAAATSASNASGAASTYVASARSAANGIGSLGPDGKQPMSEVPQAMLGANIYQGVWNATTNTPALASGVGSKGHYYIVSVVGATALDGVTDWKLGDWAIFNGSVWEKVDNTDAVISVNDKTGAVTVTADDVGRNTAQWNASKIHSRDVASTAPNNGEAFVWNGLAWAPAPIASGAGMPPVGSIIAWTGGYFTSGSNGTYTRTLGATNDASGVNAYIGDSWRVCNGAAFNDAASPIFNGTGRYLPNITDSRFLMGSTAAGGVGGSNTNSHTHAVPAHYHGKGTLAIGSSGSHAHDIKTSDGQFPGATAYDSAFNYAGGNVHGLLKIGGMDMWADYASHTHDNSAFSGVVGNGAGSNGDAAFNTGAASDTENRPAYLSIFYIIRVK